jgi:hypothetical protein
VSSRLKFTIYSCFHTLIHPTLRHLHNASHDPKSHRDSESSRSESTKQPQRLQYKIQTLAIKRRELPAIKVPSGGEWEGKLISRLTPDLVSEVSVCANTESILRTSNLLFAHLYWVGRVRNRLKFISDSKKSTHMHVFNLKLMFTIGLGYRKTVTSAFTHNYDSVIHRNPVWQVREDHCTTWHRDAYTHTWRDAYEMTL